MRSCDDELMTTTRRCPFPFRRFLTKLNALNRSQTGDFVIFRNLRVLAVTSRCSNPAQKNLEIGNNPRSVIRRTR
jgi:hypothetical protein